MKTFFLLNLPVLVLSVAAFGLFGCASSKGDLPVVKSVDLNKYSGTWYEIMRLPNSFESGLTCVTANYSIKENGDIRVLNSGHKLSDTSVVKTATGTAWVPDPSESTKLKVRFFWPFSGKYWILALDENYQHVMIGEPTREYLWIMSRTPSLDQSILDALLAQAKAQGFDITKLERTGQTCF